MNLLELVMVEKPTYFIMMDCDNVCCFPINIDTIKYYLSLNTWDALSFNRKGLPHGFENYDIWALQFEPFIHHCHSYNGKWKRRGALCQIIIRDVFNRNSCGV